MIYPWRVIIIVPLASKASAESAARAINSTGSDYEGEAFTISLSASGAGTATHCGLYTSATEQMVASMSAALPQIGGAMFWRHDQAGLLAASNVTDPEGQQWGWQQTLEAAGLAVIQSPSPVS
jgi:hypothetical protein